MNGILAKTSEDRTNNIRSTKPAESIETAGSLAMNQFHSLFETNSYDEFSTNNPFSVDYSQYSDSGETVAYSGFLSSFSNAVSTLSTTTVFSSGGTSAASCGGFSGGASAGGSCGSGGGFSSVC